jgi:hypothetical protein
LKLSYPVECDFQVLGRLSKLQELELVGTRPINLSWIPGLTRLKGLDVTGSVIEPQQLSILGQQISLENLAFSIIYYGQIATDISWVENLINLERLRISPIVEFYPRPRLTGSLSALTKLKALELGLFDANDVVFPPLAHLQGLEAFVIFAPNNITWALDTPRVCPFLTTLGLAREFVSPFTSLNFTCWLPRLG